MKELQKMALSLMLVTTISAILLSLTYAITAPQIEYQKELTINRMLTYVMPEANEYTQVDDYYIGLKDGVEIGKIYSANSYGYSNIELLFGIDNDNKLTGVSVISQQETPGLGTKIIEVRPGEKDPWYLEQYRGKTIDQVPITKDGGEIDGITSATVSSRAISDGVKLKMEEVIS